MTLKSFMPNPSHWSVGPLFGVISPEQDKNCDWMRGLSTSGWASVYRFEHGIQIDPINSEDNPVIEFMRKYRLNKPMLKKQFPPMMIISMSKIWHSKCYAEALCRSPHSCSLASFTYVHRVRNTQGSVELPHSLWWLTHWNREILDWEAKLSLRWPTESKRCIFRVGIYWQLGTAGLFR